jgi:hypothetical protein
MGEQDIMDAEVENLSHGIVGRAQELTQDTLHVVLTDDNYGKIRGNLAYLGGYVCALVDDNLIDESHADILMAKIAEAVEASQKYQIIGTYHLSPYGRVHIFGGNEKDD